MNSTEHPVPAADRRAVAVDGGVLTVGVWPGVGEPDGEPLTPVDGTVVLAIHGITASHLSWAVVARDLLKAAPGRLRVLAPDLRGRGGSHALPGPYGMVAHAEDCVAVLDAAEVDRAIVVGHSMGGFVASVLAHRHPERVQRLVLVDGGVPFPELPPGTDVDAVLDAGLGPAIARLTQTFSGPDAYRDFWRAHPAFAEWSAALDAYIAYDLAPPHPDGSVVSRTSAQAVRIDGADFNVGPDIRPAFATVAQTPPPGGLVFVRAERGMFDEPPPLYPRPEELAGLVEVRTVPDSNHYTVVFGVAGAQVIAEAVVGCDA
jgi:lipase